MTKKEIIIIGAGNAGLSAYDVLAKETDKCQVTIISEESYLRYCPTVDNNFISDLTGLYPPYGMALSPLLIDNGDDEKKILVEHFGNEVSECNKVILNSKVTRILPRDKKIVTEDGSILDYDALIVCVGANSSAVLGENENIGNVYGTGFQSDIENIINAATKSSNAVVIGAGAVGIEAAMELAERDLSVTVIEKNERVLSGLFDGMSAGIVESLLKEKGIEFYLGKEVKSIHQDSKGNVSAVTLEDGGFIKCGLVVLATGVEPYTGIAKESGIKTNRGILVDNHLKTNYSDIYAAGDVAELKLFSSSLRAILPTLVETREQGKIAAMNALYGEDNFRYDGNLPVSMLSFNGGMVFSIGKVENTKGYSVYSHDFSDKHMYLKLVFEGDQLIGVIGINQCIPVGIIRKLIADRIRLDRCKDMIIEKPNLPDIWVDTAFTKLWPNS